MKTGRRTVLLALVLVLWAQSGTPAEAVAQDREWRIELTGAVRSTAPSSVTIRDLENLSLAEYSVFDPFKKQRFKFTGVLLRDIVKQYGAADVDKVQLEAIDEYIVDFNRDDWERWDIMLATRQDGKHITIEQSGPARIVMPYDTARDIDQNIYSPKWIWLVRSIKFTQAR